MIPYSSKNTKILAFDVDGTIFSSENMIARTYQSAIENYNMSNQMNIAIPDHNSIMLEIGKPVKTIFQNLLPHLAEIERDKISDSILGLLCQKIQAGEGEFYEGVFTTIKALHEKKYTLVLASNGRAPYLDAITRFIGIHDFFQNKVTIDNFKIKTKGEILLEYSKIFQVKPAEILMIGDRFSDYEAAVKAGSPFAFCAYGHAVKDEIPEYSLKLLKISDLLQYL